MVSVDSSRFYSRGGLWGKGSVTASLGPARGRPSGRYRRYARSCRLGCEAPAPSGAAVPGRGERLRCVKDAGGPRGEPGLRAGLCAAGPALRSPCAPSGQVPREERGGAGRDLPGAGRGAARPPFRTVLRPDRASAASRGCVPEVARAELRGLGGLLSAVLSRRCFPRSGT